MRTAYEAERFEIIDRRDGALEDMKQEVRAGLTAEQKYRPFEIFLRQQGLGAVRTHLRAARVLPDADRTGHPEEVRAPDHAGDSKQGNLIELGSGANWKIRHLLDAAGARSKIRYIPVDVCESALVGAAEELLCLYPDLSISGIVADFQREMQRIGLRRATT